MDPTPAAEHRDIAGGFTALVRSADPNRWDDPAPVAGWRARDVVDHLVEWLPALLSSGSEVRLPAGPSAADDPVAAWEHHVAAVQALLEDPATAELLLTNQHIGEIPVDQAIARFYTSDVFLHTWDLAKATGQPVALDEVRCTEVLAGMEPLDQMLRESGQYGPKVEVPADADAQARLMGFIGRDPLAWP
ncbi:MAG: TIGR03086 family metal-binding protein [Marmoricola sp.]